MRLLELVELLQAGQELHVFRITQHVNQLVVVERDFRKHHSPSASERL